ncbi:MAG: hypothetical protein J0H09_24465 [Burkholderiales bacterium]|nr:hypothetical protein [Burkholderiales bacterium]
MVRIDIGRRLRIAAAVSLAALAAVAGLPSSALAQSESGPLKIVVGFAPGGGTDVVARIYADGLRQLLNTSVVVEIKPCAGGAIAVQGVVKSPSTTPTILFVIDHQVSILQHVMKTPGFDPEQDLVPIGRVVTYDMCLAVHSSLPARNVKEFIDAVKADPKLGSFAVPAPGSNAQFIGHYIGTHFGVKLEPVTYRGAAPALSDLVGGQIKTAVMPCDAFRNFTKDGTVRIIGIANDKRSERLPGVPTLREYGLAIPGANSFLGAYAPKWLDPKLVATLVNATRDMFKLPGFADRLNDTGQFANYAPPEDLARYAREASVFWAGQVKSSGFAAQ